MKIISNARELQSLRHSLPTPYVLVPTMGALHQGHFSLIKRARQISGAHGTVAVSIFVNPIQFDRKSDLEAYPNTLDEDLTACQKLGVDVVFTPNTEELYSDDRSISVVEGSLSGQLCGATRPGHFDGVCTVVCKLFNLFGATDAVFGKKDYQQLAIINRMVRDLNIPIQIHGVETVRESDGLALSSRNTRLTSAQRSASIVIREALVDASQAHHLGERDATKIVAQARQRIMNSDADCVIDYLECVDRSTLQGVSSTDTPSLLAAAVFFGEVRLIDNIELPHE